MKNDEIPAEVEVIMETRRPPLRNFIQETLKDYFEHLDPKVLATDLYDMVIKEVEIPLLEATLLYTKGNQFKAASLLGISRNTLRRKLALYQLEKK